MGLPVPILSIVGLAGILVLETSDPAQWLTKVGGNGLGAVALLFVIAANFGTAVAGIYASTVGLKAVPGLRRMSWNAALGLSLVPVMVIGVFLPNWFFDNFGTFLAYIGVFFAPLVGIQIVDYFVLRRQRISLRGIYDRSPEGPTPTGQASTPRPSWRWQPAWRPTYTCSTRSPTRSRSPSPSSAPPCPPRQSRRWCTACSRWR